MINTRIAISLFSILVALALTAGATFALFTDQATSTGNVFATGDASLLVSLDDGGTPLGFAQSIEAPDFSGLFPGDSRDYIFWLKNDSSAAIDLDLTADVDAISPALDIDQLIDNTLLVRWVCDTDGNGGVGDNTPTAEFSPRAWLDGGSAAIGQLNPGEEMVCRMTGRLPSDATDTVTGETVDFDVVYKATQVTP